METSTVETMNAQGLESSAKAIKEASRSDAIARLNEGIDFSTLDNYEFGGKIAKQVGADLSADHNNEAKKSAKCKSEETMQAAAKPQDWRSKLSEMDHDKRVEAVLECLGRKNNQKEILYDLLVFCKEERDEQEAEAFLEAHKEFANGYHSANKYLFFMMRTGGIEEIQYDSDGVRITDDMRDELIELGATPEEVEGMAVEWHFKTTDAGIEAIEKFDPVDRTKEMLATQANSRMATYARLLEFCETPRSLQEIVEFMKDDPGLEIDPETHVMGMQPSGYIGKLDQAGALTWEDGWKTTPGGLEVLKTLDVE